MSTVSEMSEKGPLWDSLVARYGLHATPYEQIATGLLWTGCLTSAKKTILSTIKIRKAGSQIVSTRMKASDGNSRSSGNFGSSHRCTRPNLFSYQASNEEQVRVRRIHPCPR